MKQAQTPPPDQDAMRPEYDFTGVPAVRGKHAAAMRQGYTCTVHHPDGTREITHVRPLEGSVVLDPDVQAYFPDAEAVNTALRGLIALRPRRRRGRKATS
jgi:hypothetical protein